MERKMLASSQEKKVEELHWEIQQWKSNFQFIEDEITFILKLLDSYAFQPNTPNLFERLQDYKSLIKKTISNKEKTRNHIAKHENSLGGMLECTDSACDLAYYTNHNKLETEVENFWKDFKNLKSEIFNYAGGILKKRKP